MHHRKLTHATIASPPAEVFDWMTTPSNWPRCSPVTLSVDADHPLRAGDRVTEHMQVLGWREQLDWTVDVFEFPNPARVVHPHLERRRRPPRHSPRTAAAQRAGRGADVRGTQDQLYERWKSVGQSPT